MNLLDQIETQQLAMRRAKRHPLLLVEANNEPIGNTRPFYHSYRIAITLGKQVQYCESDRVDQVTKLIRNQLSDYIYGEIKSLLTELEIKTHAGEDIQDVVIEMRRLME